MAKSGSIHKQIESFEGVEKYVMSEADYEKLPENFRKWKQEQLKKYPELLKQAQNVVKTEQYDPDYLSELASSIQFGSRCRTDTGARGRSASWAGFLTLGLAFSWGYDSMNPSAAETALSRESNTSIPPRNTVCSCGPMPSK
jgi:hypothetical protein